FHVTQIGAPVAKLIYRFGIWLSTLGQEPPGADKLEARHASSEKKPLAERILPYSPPGLLARRGRPMPLLFRIVWFLLAGWWLGGIWVILCWSFFILPYPMLDTVRTLLDQVPSVMTLALPSWPAVESAPVESAPVPE